MRLNAASRLGQSALSLLVVLGLAGCGAEVEQALVAPELAEAKGGNKGGGGGGDTSEPPSLVEFFVFEEAGVQMVHVVLEGEASEIGHQTSVDHFHNGHVDRDDHYEYFNLRAPRRTPQAVAGSLLHADVPFDGGLVSDPFTTYFDHPYLDVDGSGADPFVFQVLVWREGESGIHRLDPRAVLADPSIGLHEGVANSSFAVFLGDPAPARIWVENLTVDAITCDVTTVRSAGSLSQRSAGVTSGSRSLYMDVAGTPGDIYLVMDYVYPDAGWGVYDPASNTPSAVPDGLEDHFPAGTPLVVSAPASCPG